MEDHATMDDQTSWKGHTFTLFVFTGIVVLCSIFFILGMLVGRAEGQKLAASAASDTAAKLEARLDARPAQIEDKPAFTFYDSVKKEDSAELQPAPARPDPAPLTIEPAKKAEPAAEPPSPPPAAPSVIHYQIGALQTSAAAEKLLSDVKKKGFRAFILEPAPGEKKPVFRVQVGPFADVLEAQATKKKLETAGYQPIPRK